MPYITALTWPCMYTCDSQQPCPAACFLRRRAPLEIVLHVRVSLSKHCRLVARLSKKLRRSRNAVIDVGTCNMLSVNVVSPRSEMRYYAPIQIDRARPWTQAPMIT